MQSPYKDIKKPEHELLKPYKLQNISDYLNPTKALYWQVNGAITILAIIGRQLATIYRGPRIIFSAAAISIPVFAILDLQKLLSLNTVRHRKTLEERLEFAPLTRNAYKKALEINEQKVAELKQEINYYKSMLNETEN